MASNLAKVDAYVNGPADYDEIPELTAEDFARGTLMFNGKPLERAGSRSDGTELRQHVLLQLDATTVEQLKALAGLGERINDILRTWLTRQDA